MPLPTTPGFQPAMSELTSIVRTLPGFMKSNRDALLAGEVSRETIKNLWILTCRDIASLTSLSLIPEFSTYVDSQFAPGVLGGDAATMFADALAKLTVVRDEAKSLIPVDGSGNILGSKFDDANGTITTDDTTGLNTAMLVSALNDLLTWAEG